MTASATRGLTLIELLLAITIIAMMAAASASLLSISLRATAYGAAHNALAVDGALAMERISADVQLCTFLLIPNGRRTSWTRLVISGTVNDDNDYYFNDPLFPRIDEDTSRDMTADGKAGVMGYDDDGFGGTDEGNSDDDDEDASLFFGGHNEDKLDAIDNDGDGSVDEDVDDDMNMDGKAGIKGMDDDGDGAVDEGYTDDDDEDGVKDEDPLNPLVYYVSAGILLIKKPGDATAGARVCDNVTQFTVAYEAPDASHNPRVLISLTLSKNGDTVVFNEYAYPRNVVQKTGKRVR